MGNRRDKVNVAPNTVNSDDPRGFDALTRRQWLKAAAVATSGALLPRLLAQSSQPASQPTARPATSRPAIATPPWWLGPDFPRSRVIEVSSPHVVTGVDIDEAALSEMLEMGLQVLTRTRATKAAWKAILGTAKQILLKFNEVGAEVLGVNTAMAGVLVRMLHDAGYPARSLTAVEIPRALLADLGTRQADAGWGTPIPIGNSEEALSTYLHASDAVVNIGLLKTHQIAGMSGVMKNLSHALIEHPARYHANGCSPFVGQVISSKEVSSRLRLNIANALRVVCRNGPDARREDVLASGYVLLGFDPVAVDTVGRDLLTATRRKVGLTEKLDVRYLEAAADDGVGRLALHELERVPVLHGG